MDDEHSHEHSHDHGHEQMSWNPTRLLRAVALGAWAAFFVWLLTSGSASTYIAPRTNWVVAVGAVLLPVVAVAYLIGVRRPGRAPSPREIGANGLLVAPVLLALMVPAPSLGAQAVKNKRVDNAPAPANAPADGTVRLFEIAWASEDADFAEMAGIKEGTEVDFTGFVSANGADGTVELSRFRITHCAADATAYTVTVTLPDGAAEFPLDTWLQVKGKLAGVPGEGMTVTASSAEEVAPPDDQYGYW